MAWYTELKYWDNGTRRIDIYPDGSKIAEKAKRRLDELGVPYRASSSCSTHDIIKEFAEIKKPAGYGKENER